MGRGKLKLEFIANLKTRKTTFQKRKNGLLKKASEFSILCGTDICLFISGPKLDSNEPPLPVDELETWPPERSKVMDIINKYQATMQRKPPKKVHGLADTFVERKKKIDAEISRCRKKLYEAKYPTTSDIVQHFSREQLKELSHRLDGKIEAIKFVLEAKKESELHKNNQYSAVVNSSNSDNDQFQLLFDQIPQSICSDDMQFGTGTNLQGPVFADPMAGIQWMFDNPMAEMRQMGPFMGCPNYMQYGGGGGGASAMQGPVFADPTAGMVLGNMNLSHVAISGGGDGGDSSSFQMQAQNYPPLQVQPPVVPYIQLHYPMNVMNLAQRVGTNMSRVVRSSSGERNQLFERSQEF
ncbi:hypothetical protein TIFTF001_001961 [Ficus carica]|uniref:MADS-box domain-containing protein n=1 Tax=Ficus carica TaxID=3494 RepID=A0AA87Z2G8_FICCA|nr:hypothetical protein TIFTF001_001961 [Ficus carica]